MQVFNSESLIYAQFHSLWWHPFPLSTFIVVCQQMLSPKYTTVCVLPHPRKEDGGGGKQWSPPIHLFALEQWQELLILDKRIISGLVLPILHGGVRALCSGVPTQMDQMNLISCFFSFVRGHFLVVLVFSLGLVAHGCFGFSQSGRFIISRSHGSERHVAALFPWMDTQD